MYKIISFTNLSLFRPSLVRLVLAFIACFVIAGSAQQGVAQDVSLTGVWTHSRDAKEQAGRYGAIEQVTNNMNRLMRGRAREMLRAKTTPHSTIQITDEGDRVTFSGEKHRVTFKTDGKSTRVVSERGTATARAQRKNEKLILTSQGKDGGVQTTVYSLSEDGKRLILDIAINAKMLESPIRYRATYHREAEHKSK